MATGLNEKKTSLASIFGFFLRFRGAMGIVEEVEAKIEALKLRLPELEGKANKRERTQVNKDIYALENDEAYVAAKKGEMQATRAETAAADDAAHATKLQQEAEAEAARAAAAEAAAAKRAAEGPAKVEDDGEVHMEKATSKKGDESTWPANGDMVGLTYTGVFADGTSHQGVDYSGQQFDSTWDSKAK